MFDPNAQAFFEELPTFDGLGPAEARRALTQAYLIIVQLRTSGVVAPGAVDAIAYLRRLANTTMAHGIFPRISGEGRRRACAFIAAEALALLADFSDTVVEIDPRMALRNANQFVTRIESALLYLIAQYDANAGAIVRAAKIPAATPEAERSAADAARDWCFEQLRALCVFELNPLPSPRCPVVFKDDFGGDPYGLMLDTIGRLYGMFGEAVAVYLHWLAARDDNGLIAARSACERIVAVLSPAANPGEGTPLVGDDYARVYHFTRLFLEVIDGTSNRALAHSLSIPPRGLDPEIYQHYLKTRAAGISPGDRARPLLWPSALAYFQACVAGGEEGHAQHAVASMPTGSGKSFLAEIAISQNVGLGWCLYLVPTNALAHQVRNELRTSLKKLETKIQAFIGDAEYSVLEADLQIETRPNTVAVMTPEKCALALRLKPEVFRSCCLVIFDECHLMGEKNSSRGATAELVVSNLIAVAPNCRFLLMSAIIQNAQELSDWLAEATHKRSVPITLAWRPTRTLRGSVGVDPKTLHEKSVDPITLLKTKPARQSAPFQANYVLVANLQGAWQESAQEDYLLATLPVQAQLKVIRDRFSSDRFSWTAESWVNHSAAALAEFTARRGIPTLVFMT